MRRWLCILVLVSLAGCSSRSLERGWSSGWALVSAPVFAVCAPYNALWDLAIWQEDFAADGLTANMWGLLRKRLMGEEFSWAAPLGLILYPLVTVLQPLTGFLHLLGGVPVS